MHNNPPWRILNIFKDIPSVESIRFQHVYGEVDGLANWVANFARSSPEFCILSSSDLERQFCKLFTLVN